MYIARRTEAQTRGAFLADYREPAVLTGDISPPVDVVHLPANCLYVAQLNGIRDCPSFPTATDIPDCHAVVPERGHENAITNEHIVDEWTSHYTRKHHGRRGGTGDVDDDQSRSRACARIDRKKSIKLSANRLHLGRMHTGIRVGILEA